MSLSTSARTWDETSSPAAIGLVKRYEAAWRNRRSHRPSLEEYDQAGLAPGTRLALLRADLGLRWEFGEPVSAEWYREHVAALDADSLVALIYEEYCLREERGESPKPEEFYARFRDVETKLRRVLEIHDLVGQPSSTALHVHQEPKVPFPGAGQTIGGFHLVEELGRGAFARVFQAQERMLADRPVVLKVARRASQEPQTLARLQHTHIVPIHSYRTDPATGLHLLCMPYLGRATLAHLLADPEGARVATGRELLDVLDRLEPGGRAWSSNKAPMGRRELTARSFTQGIAWWGARLAEALQHAHEHGVLHLDIKPSNVLITGDALPMLLDFNLAQPQRLDQPDEQAETLGGTLAYMAPEHLEALADGTADNVDARSDIYSLGIVLFEAMGTRPFSPLASMGSVTESLLHTAEERRGWMPRLREIHPEVPPAFEAVVCKCLQPAKGDRYQSAADLAIDLQAVADDEPLRFAKESWPSRSWRWVKRRRRKLAIILPTIVALGVVGRGWMEAQMSRVLLEGDFKHWMSKAENADADDRPELALSYFQTAADLALGLDDRGQGRRRAQTRVLAARNQVTIRGHCDRVLEDSGRLRFQLLGYGGDPERDTEQLWSLLRPFYVRENEDWSRRDDLNWLRSGRRNQLTKDVGELLYLWAWMVARSQPNLREAQVWQAVEICDKAVRFVPLEERSAWLALKCRLLSNARELHGRIEPRPGQTQSVWPCVQWALLNQIDSADGMKPASAWLERAVRIDRRHVISHFLLGRLNEDQGQVGEAIEHLGIASVCNLTCLGFSTTLARQYRKRAAWASSEECFEAALSTARAWGFDFAEARLELGDVLQSVGKTERAREAYEAIIRDETEASSSLVEIAMRRLTELGTRSEP